MSDPFFFGYGSLVNRATHTYPQARTARVTGWARTWQGTTLRRVAFLTAVPAPGQQIEGLIAAVPDGDWAALDIRERAYARHSVTLHTNDAAQPDTDLQIYSVAAEHADTSDAHPILLSYLDTVIQGYLQEFGETGAQAFFKTTGGWHHPLIDDRAAPVYPRAQTITRDEAAFVDAQLAAIGVRPTTA